MPSGTSKACGIAELVGETTTLLLLLRTNDTDLITQFTAFFGQGMNMEAR
jgi:hypothetical protein